MKPLLLLCSVTITLALLPPMLEGRDPGGPFLCKVDVVDSLFAAGIGFDGTVLWTTDGGWTWTPGDSGRGLPSPYRYDIDLLSRDTGWALTGSPEPSRILRTTNGGVTWEVQYTQACSPLRALHMLGNRHGWAVGESGSTLRTTDGGLTWRTRPCGTSDDLSDVFFVDSLHGWAVGRTFLRTTTGGESWEMVAGIGAETVYFLDSLNGWIGSDGVSRTTDGGLTWQRLGELGNGLVISTDLVFHDLVRGESTVWDMNPDPPSGHSSALMATSDGGVTWHPRVTDCSLFGLSFDGGGYGMAVGSAGVLFTTDDGTSWSLRGLSGTGSFHADLPTLASLDQNYPNPFNPATNLTFTLPAGGSGHVFLGVYDLLGRHVATLVDGALTPGSHTVRWEPSSSPSGVYYSLLRAGRTMISRKMVLIR